MRRLLLLASAVVFVNTAFYAAITPLLPHYVDSLAADLAGPEPVFCAVGATGIALMAAALRMPARAPTSPPRLATLAEALRDREVPIGQTSGSAGSARLADLTSDDTPYLVLACACAVTFAALRSRALRVAR